MTLAILIWIVGALFAYGVTTAEPGLYPDRYWRIAGFIICLVAWPFLVGRWMQNK